MLEAHAQHVRTHGEASPRRCANQRKVFQAGERRAQPAKSRSTSASTVTSGAGSLLFLTNDVRYPDNRCNASVESFVIDRDSCELLA